MNVRRVTLELQLFLPRRGLIASAYACCATGLTTPIRAVASLAANADRPIHNRLDAAARAACVYIRFETGGEGEETLKTALASFGYGNFAGFFFEGKKIAKHRFDTQAFAVVSAARTALIVFRGTQPDSIRDLITDLSF